jgi:hypothetical protein
MIWDSNSSKMEKPNVNEREHIMRFQNGTTILPNILKAICKQILGQIMNFNYFTWVFNLALVKQRCFVESHTST